MAVVFVSSKQKIKVFLVGIIVLLLLFLAGVSLFVFLSKPKEISPEMVFYKPPVNVNIKIFDSDEFKNLQSFSNIGTLYSYIAINRNRKIETGFVVADSLEQATTNLESRGLTISEIKEIEPGRDNPFRSYY